ncbi:MAG: hypothetical protein QOI20_51 [Acidimicrobiaceae bacterium]|nr:hypothetical protein [Acidimicrobiaceae bacterium]
MTTPHRPVDALAALAAADPARSAAFDPASPRGRAVLQRAKAAAPTSGARRRRPRGTALATVAVVGLAGLVAATAYVNTRRPSRTLDVGCYAAPRLDADTFVVRADARTAVQACWRLWRSGRFSPAPTPARLTACVLPSGVVGVFPGGAEACARVGRPLAPARAQAEPRVAALNERLDAAVRDAPCMDEPTARGLVQSVLADVGLSEWTVVMARPYQAGRPCTTFAIDEPERRVTLVPVARR